MLTLAYQGIIFSACHNLHTLRIYTVHSPTVHVLFLSQKETEKLKEEFEKKRQTLQAEIARHEKTNNTLQVLCGCPHVNAKCICWSVVLSFRV